MSTSKRKRLSIFAKWLFYHNVIQRELSKRIYRLKESKIGASSKEIERGIEEGKSMPVARRINGFVNRSPLSVGYAKLIGEILGVDYVLLMDLPDYEVADVYANDDAKWLLKHRFGIDLNKYTLVDGGTPNHIPADTGNIYMNGKGTLYIKKRAAELMRMLPEDRYHAKITGGGRYLEFIRSEDGLIKPSEMKNHDRDTTYTVYSFFIKKYLDNAGINHEPKHISMKNSENGYIFELFY